MVVDKEAISLSRVYSYYSKCTSLSKRVPIVVMLFAGEDRGKLFLLFQPKYLLFYINLNEHTICPQVLYCNYLCCTIGTYLVSINRDDRRKNYF